MCACQTTGPFATPRIKTFNSSGLIGAFSHPTDGMFTVSTQAVGGSVDLSVKDSQQRPVLSVSGPVAWGPSPDGKFFAVVFSLVGTNAGAPMTVHRVAKGPATWQSILSTEVWPDGRWGFSGDGSQIIITRLQNMPVQFSLEAHNLRAPNPTTAVLRLNELNVTGATVTVSPCGDRLMYFRWLQMSPLTGQGDFYARSSFGVMQNLAVTDWDGGSNTMPTAASIMGTGMNNFQVQLNGLTSRSTGQHTIASLQCMP